MLDSSGMLYKIYRTAKVNVANGLGGFLLGDVYRVQVHHQVENQGEMLNDSLFLFLFFYPRGRVFMN